MTKEIYIKVTKNGPYLVYGAPKIHDQKIVVDAEGVSIIYEDGEIHAVESEPVALCRCGESKNAPFCDGSHIKVGFEGAETASFEPILKNAVAIEGPNLTLMDNENYCSFARFCDAHGRVWNLVQVGRPDTDKMAIADACNCPAGRLIILDEQGRPFEHKYEPSIGVLEDGGLKISGPLWVKGGIRVESESGKSYEVRNRQTLCRCGKSGNKPFCNGAHASIKFKAKRK